MKDVKMHTEDAITNIAHEYVTKCENHVKNIEERYWENDGLTLPPIELW